MINGRNLNRLCFFLFTISCFLAITVCSICNIAVSRDITWAYIPISSIVFGWFVLFPCIRFGRKGVYGTLAACSILIIPFLAVLNYYIESNNLILQLGGPIAIMAIIYLWVNLGLFKMLTKRKKIAAGIGILLTIPLDMGIQYILFRVIDATMNGFVDILGYVAVAVVAVFLFISDCTGSVNQAS